VKLPRYAQAGIPEVWIVDLAGGVVDIHREPSAGGYRVSRHARRGEDVAPATFPDVVLAVNDILG
jgi:Uma2 family endonuclease